MKFAEKIIWSCLLTLAILFSIGSAIMIYQNHQNLLHTTIHQYLSIQDTELYSLETRLYQDSISRESYFDDKYLMNRAIYYVGQFQHITQTKKTYALSLPDKTIFYNNIDEAYQEYISIDNNQKYFIKHKNNQYKMIVTSKINMRENSFYLTSCYDLTSVYQDRQRQIGNFLVTSVILFFIAYVILKFLSSYLTQSIHKLNEVSQRIADGNYSERTHITSEDEIGELSKVLMKWLK